MVIFLSLDLLTYILPLVPLSLLSSLNSSKSTPLHWASTNRHLSTSKLLIDFPNGPGVDLIDLKNAAGRTALGEAAIADWDEGVDYFVGVVKLDVNEAPAGEGDEVEDGDVGEPTEIEIEVEGADGELSRMSIRADGSTATTTSTTTATAEKTADVSPEVSSVKS